MARSKKRAWLTTDTEAAADFICRRLRIPNDVHLVGAVTGALLLLTEPHNWEKFGVASPEQTAALFADMLTDYLESDICMLGMIQPFMGTTPPANAMLCNGAVQLREDWPAFYEFLQAEADFQIIDEDSFYAPLLDNRSLIAAGDQFPHLSAGGSWSREITVDNLPAHSHETTPHSHTTHSHVTTAALEPGEVPVSSPWILPESTGVSGVTVLPTGADLPLSIVPYYVALNYIVWAR